MNKAALPTSKAKTAYQVLSDVKKVILEEPKRYDQHTWLYSAQGVSRMKRPACNAIACVGGWVVALVSGGGWADGPIGVRAQHILGLDDDQAYELFNGGALIIAHSVKHGTKLYAEAGARHISAFQKKYARQLKATKVRR